MEPPDGIIGFATAVPPARRRLDFRCTPFFVQPPNPIVVEIWDESSPAPSDDMLATLEIKQADGEVVFRKTIILEAQRQHRSVETISVDLLPAPGVYAVAAAAAGASLFVVRNLVVTEPGFSLMMDKLRDAIAFHSGGVEAVGQRLFQSAVAPLQRSAELFSEVDEIECSVMSWRDLAFVHLELGDDILCAETCRKGLWTGLVAAYELTSQGPFDALKAARRSETSSVSAIALARELSPSMIDLCSLADDLQGRLPESYQGVVLNPRNDLAEDIAGLRRALAALTTLRQRDEVFQTILRSLLSDVVTADAAYLCLSAIDGVHAVSMLPDIGSAAIAADSGVHVQRAMKRALLSVDIETLYGYLPYVARSMPGQALKVVIPAILATRPVEAVVLDDEWLLYEPGKVDCPIAQIPNDDLLTSFLSPHFAQATYEEARSAMDGVE